MKLKNVLLISLILMPVFISKIAAQSEVKQFPANYEGHDPAILYANLKTLIEQNNLEGKSNKKIEKAIKGKIIYENLTTDNYFAFTLDRGDYEWGSVSGSRNYYRVVTFPLLKLNEFPSPRKKFPLGGMGTGGPPTISTPLELISNYTEDVNLTDLWTSSYLPIKTVFTPEALAKDYTGVKADCYPSSYNASVQVCYGRDFTVPSPQIHYGLSFVNKQSLPLVSMKDQIISLDTYKDQNREIAGIAAWLADSEKKTSYVSPIIIVKLVPPYIQTKTFEQNDLIEKEPHKAVRNIIYADLVGVWVYNVENGKIISKNGDKLESTADDLNPVKAKEKDAYLEPPPPPRVNTGPSRSIKILSKPRPRYTDKARQNNLMGVVYLKITFLASGRIGSVSVVKGLPYGLTDKAIEAARQIKFSPELRKGVPTTVTKVLTYNFTIY